MDLTPEQRLKAALKLRLSIAHEKITFDSCSGCPTEDLKALVEFMEAIVAKNNLTY